MYQKNFFGEELKPGERLWFFAPTKRNQKKISFHGTDRTTSLRKCQGQLQNFKRFECKEMADRPVQPIKATQRR